MTPTVRYAIARRRKRMVIAKTVRERAEQDPRRRQATDGAATAA